MLVFSLLSIRSFSFRLQEKEIEEKLRAKYTLIDKTDSSAIAAAQQAGIAIGDDGELVGEPEGTWHVVTGEIKINETK